MSRSPAANTDRRRSALARLLPHLGVFATLIALWEGASVAGWTNSFLVPRPSGIAAALADLYVFEGTIWRHFFITLYETVAGFLIGATVGISLAVASALNARFRRYASPYAVLLNVTPGLALTPIVIAWFGFGFSSKIALAAIICFFPIFVNTLTGLTRVDPDREELFRAIGASRLQVFLKLQLPAALPVTFAGLKIGMTTALIGAVVAEFAQATAGVGILMQRFSFALDMASSFATLASMSLMGLTLFTIMEILDDRIVFWRRDARMAAVSRARAASFVVRCGETRNEALRGGQFL